MSAPDSSVRRTAPRGHRRRSSVLAWLAVLTVMLFVAPTISTAAQTSATPIAAPPSLVWTEIGSDGQLNARALAATACPDITIDDQSQPMVVRASATADFPGVVCEAVIPANAKTAAIDSQSLALLPDTLTRIAVIGDTGCRVKGDDYQDCANPEAWPLQTIAAQVAAWRPELIIHVGDYIYRESPCPEDAGCAGSPFGDNAATWRADVFTPLADLLPTTPWLFIRGNHETCARAGVGWFRYLAPEPAPAACEQFTAPFPLTLPGGIHTVVMDSAEIGDVHTTPEINAAYIPQLQEVAALANSGTWLLTHKPLAGALLDFGQGEQVATYATLRAIANNELPHGISLAIAGHVHLGQALLFRREARTPTQLVVGNSGTRLDKGETATFAGEVLGDPDLGLGFIDAGFGYTRLEPAADRLTVTAVALDGGTTWKLVLPRSS
ncbi:MAG: metallophosphoesterase [Thermomicrobiales bacterium]|nr:metallophosphoesterase [Thermomicrobiales bacterium]